MIPGSSATFDWTKPRTSHRRSVVMSPPARHYPANAPARGVVDDVPHEQGPKVYSGHVPSDQDRVVDPLTVAFGADVYGARVGDQPPR
jgi:hypothetical protein